MVKVLIYSSKEIYDTSSYEGRAEADIIAYREDDLFYNVKKNTTSVVYMGDKVSVYKMKSYIRLIENDEFNKEMEKQKS
jgi:hypothetical protein